jgi:hypothetical protein
MNALVFNLLFAVIAADGSAAVENPVLVELIQKGVATPDGTTIKLPAPTMTDDPDAGAQTAAIAKGLPRGVTAEEFFEKNSAAPIALKVKTVHSGEATFRTIDLGFIAHGRWDTLLSDKFSESMFKTKKQENEEKGQTVSKLGFLTPEEMHSRKLVPVVKDDIEERFFYTTFRLFDEVEVSATRRTVVTRTPQSVVLAARIDSRFSGDPDFPNQWRPIERDAAANLVFGKPKPYSGAGFYVKATRLAKPAGTIYVEYHSAFHEPQGWFNGENTLRAKLPLIVQTEVKQFRGKFARASIDEVAEKP